MRGRKEEATRKNTKDSIEIEEESGKIGDCGQTKWER